MSAVNLFAPAASIGGNLDGSRFDGAVLFGSVFRSPEGKASFMDTSLDGVQVKSDRGSGSTLALTRVSMTGLQIGSSTDESAAGWATVNCQVVWKMHTPDCAEGSTVQPPQATPTKDVTAFYDDLLPDWTREDIALAESL